MNRLDRRRSLSLLEAAFAAGLTHFDTAPLYGYGEAEAVLGDFIAARRSEVTVTTKIGILPPAPSPVLNIAKSIARRIAGLHPKLRQEMQRRASRMVSMGAFDTTSMQRSLDRSLRVLRTDYIDYLLLHEARQPDLVSDKVMEFLESAKRTGRIGAYGLGTDIDTTRTAINTASPLAGIVQFASSAFDRNVEFVAAPAQTRMITHSALSKRFRDLVAALARDSALHQRWNKTLGFDPNDSGQLGRLLLAVALHKNPNGMVLFSSHSPARIAQNATLLHDRIPADEVLAVSELALAWASTQPPT